MSPRSCFDSYLSTLLVCNGAVGLEIEAETLKNLCGVVFVVFDEPVVPGWGTQALFACFDDILGLVTVPDLKCGTVDIEGNDHFGRIGGETFTLCCKCHKAKSSGGSWIFVNHGVSI